MAFNARLRGHKQFQFNEQYIFNYCSFEDDGNYTKYDDDVSDSGDDDPDNDDNNDDESDIEDDMEDGTEGKWQLVSLMFDVRCRFLSNGQFGFFCKLLKLASYKVCVPELACGRGQEGQF